MKSTKWTDIKAGLKPRIRAGIEAGGHELAEELHLAQLRKAKGLTQEAIAEPLGVSQAEVSKTERRAELYVGTLRSLSRQWKANSYWRPASRTVSKFRSNWAKPTAPGSKVPQYRRHRNLLRCGPDFE